MMKNLICFSLWGNIPMYTQGLIENINLQKSIYPGWTIRVYIDKNIDPLYLETLKIYDIEIFERGPNINCSGAFWRYESIFSDNEDVENIIFRDADSRLSNREKYVVNEWTSSEYPIHIMRDWPGHVWNIMGGMWGINLKKVSPDFISWFKETYKKYTIDPSCFPYGGDENFLKTLVWDKVKDNQLTHISSFKFSNIIKNKNEHIFPTPWENEYDFVGNKYDENNKGMFSLKSIGVM